jgi:hypothetical protein
MGRRTTFILAIFGAVVTNSVASAQFVPFTDTLMQDSVVFEARPINQNAFHLSIRSEFGEATLSNFQYGVGFDIGKGDWVIQGDYRSYGGVGRPNNTAPTSWDVLLIGWVANGNPISTAISNFPNTLDGVNEYSLTAGKILRAFDGTIVFTPTIGLAAVSRKVVHYNNCAQVAQPGTALYLFIPVPDTETYYQYNATVEPEVDITIPLSLHMVVKFSSWIGLSASAWTEIGYGGTSGWSAGLEVGALP